MVVENGAVALQMVNQQQGQTDRGDNICQIGLQPAYLLPKMLSKIYQTDDHTRASNHAKMAQIAKQVQPGMLILVHQLFWGESEEELVQEIQAEYDGVVISGKDLDIF